MNHSDMSLHTQGASAEVISFDEKLKRLKKSIAKMMVYWVVNSRHDLREDLLANNPDGEWAGLNFKTVFDDDDEWKGFFAKASKLHNKDEVKKGSEKVSLRVHGADGEGDPDWASELDPLCPDNATLNVMFSAAIAFVENKTW